MAFDADAFEGAMAAARTPWTVTARGKTYAATDVSVEVVVRFIEDYDAAGRAGESVRAVAVLRRFLYRLFPWRPSFLWRDPVGVILRLPDAAREALLTDFFGSRARRTPTIPSPSAAPPSASSSAAGRLSLSGPASPSA